MDPRQTELRRRLLALGFDEVAFAPADTAASGWGLPHWLAAGAHADMTWLERTAAKRMNPDLVLPGARSVIALGINYWPGGPAPGEPKAARSPVWARYALHEDYHETVRSGLQAAARALEEICGVGGGDYRYYVDTGPVMERGWAERAGLGFLGKNGMLISRTHGNWLLLAAILVRLDLEPDPPLRPRLAAAPGSANPARLGLLCGKCTRCMDACPTAAIPRPGWVDARRCISYQTIENRGAIPRDLRPGIGDRIFGCDICLEVCPWNRFARAGRGMLVATRREIAATSLAELLELTPAGFARLFRRTPIKRLKLAGLLRNACVVAGNVAAGAGAADPLLAPLLRLAGHADPVVRGHAVWAVRRIAGPAARSLLAAARARESEASVLGEYDVEIPGAGATGTAPSSA